MPSVEPGSVVAVTGATGFIGSHVCKVLLENGYQVRAVVRNPDDESKVSHLLKMGQNFPNKLTLHKGDLLQDGSYDEAFLGAAGVIHTAAVVEINDVKDPLKEIVEPSTKGTENVLSSIRKSGSVKRVIHTSSVAAVHSIDKPTETVFNEDNWNEFSTIDNGDPYGFAKTQSERFILSEALKDTSYDVVTINPAVVLGPCLTKQHTKASVVIIRQLIYGNEQPNYFTSFVDVRDVAIAHVEALKQPIIGNCRYIVAGDSSLHIAELGPLVQNLFPDLIIEAKSKDPLIINTTAFLSYIPWIGPKLMTEFQRNMVQKKFYYKSAKAKEELGIQFRPLEITLKDSVDSMITTGWIKPKSKPSK